MISLNIMTDKNNTLDTAHHWKRPLKNSGIAGMGKVGQAILSLIALALAARQLGPEVFGYFVLIHGMVFGLSQILRVRSGEAVIRYGAWALHNNTPDRLQNLIRYCFTLDLLAALFGAALTVLLVAPGARLFNLPEDQIWMAQLYALSIALIILTPSQTGTLRLLNRFDLLAVQVLVAPAIRLGGTLYLFFTNGDLGAYLIVWFAGQFVARQVMFALARYELNRRDLGVANFAPVNPFGKDYDFGIDNAGKGQTGPLLRFIFSHNVGLSFKNAQDQIALLMTGWFLGPAAAGIFRVAQKFADILIKPPAQMFIPALYPELARYEASGDGTGRRVTLARNLAALLIVAATVFAVLVFGGPYLIRALYGPAYDDAYGPMLWLCIAGLVATLSYPLEPLLSAAGKVGQIMLAYIVAVAVLVAAVVFLGPVFGLPAAGMAVAAAALTSAVILFFGGGARLLARGDDGPSARSELPSDGDSLP